MLRLTTLGALDLRDRHGKPVRDLLAQPKRLALLVFLAIESRRAPVTRDRLLALFWPESDAARARNTLSQALFHIRQALGTDVFDAEGAAALRVRADQLWCDAAEFAEAVERGEAELALDLYRGDFCPALFVSGAADVEVWLGEQRSRLARLAIATARASAERFAEAGDGPNAVRAARRALALRPEDEADVRALIGVLDASGDATAAVLAYQEYEERLARDLDAAPEKKTRELVEAIRRRREPLVPVESDPPPIPPGGSAGTSSQSPVRTPRWGIAAAAVAALVLVTGGLIARGAREDAIAVRANAIAVFPFPVRGAPAHGWLREGLVDLLSVKFDGLAGIQAIAPTTVLRAAQRAGAADADPVAVAGSLGAGRWVTGEVVASGPTLEITASLYRAGARDPVARATVRGDTAAIFALVDGLGARLLPELVASRDSALTQLAAVSTPSLPALRAYLEGERAMRAGLDAQAAAAFRDAATIDTAFALALYRLAVMSTWVAFGTTATPLELAHRAARHSARLTPLARDLLRAYVAYKNIEGDNAERMYRSITASHPDNVEAWFMLAETLFHYNPLRGRRASESEAAFRQVIAFDSSNAHALLHVARLAALEGRPLLLDSVVRAFRGLFREADRTLEVRALEAIMHGDSAAIRRIAQELRTTDTWQAASIVQAASAYGQDLAGARALASAFGPTSGSVDGALVPARTLADAALAEGRWDQEPPGLSRMDRDWFLESSALVAAEPFFAIDTAAVSRLRRTIAGHRTWSSQAFGASRRDIPAGASMRAYLLGLLDARLGDTAAFAASRRDLVQLGGGDPRAFDLSIALDAALARRRGDRAGAERLLARFPLDPIYSSHWGVAERFARAELLAELGRADDALELYESMTSSWDLPFVAPAHLRAAELHERAGRRERALFHYTRFVRMWEHCDAAWQPVLARARAALVRLGPSPA